MVLIRTTLCYALVVLVKFDGSLRFHNNINILQKGDDSTWSLLGNKKNGKNPNDVSQRATAKPMTCQGLAACAAILHIIPDEIEQKTRTVEKLSSVSGNGTVADQPDSPKGTILTDDGPVWLGGKKIPCTSTTTSTQVEYEGLLLALQGIWSLFASLGNHDRLDDGGSVLWKRLTTHDDDEVVDSATNRFSAPHAAETFPFSDSSLRSQKADTSGFVPVPSVVTIRIQGDCKTVIQQMQGRAHPRQQQIEYCQRAQQWVKEIQQCVISWQSHPTRSPQMMASPSSAVISFEYIPRVHNQESDALAALLVAHEQSVLFQESRAACTASNAIFSPFDRVEQVASKLPCLSWEQRLVLYKDMTRWSWKNGKDPSTCAWIGEQMENESVLQGVWRQSRPRGPKWHQNQFHDPDMEEILLRPLDSSSVIAALDDDADDEDDTHSHFRNEERLVQVALALQVLGWHRLGLDKPVKKLERKYHTWLPHPPTATASLSMLESTVESWIKSTDVEEMERVDELAGADDRRGEKFAWLADAFVVPAIRSNSWSSRGVFWSKHPRHQAAHF